MTVAGRGFRLVLGGLAAVLSAGMVAVPSIEAHAGIQRTVYYNWAQFRLASDHSGVNPAANGLTAATVGKLKGCGASAR